MKIAHVSDFHASGSWFDEKAFEAGVERVNALGVDQVIFTGDLTDHGTRDEFDRTVHLLDAFDAPVSSVMGNHDAMREGWRIFSDRLMGGDRYYARDFGAYTFVGLDSAEPDVNEGHIGREQMGWLESQLEGTDKPAILALHHHVLPVPYTGRERNILLDSGELLRLITTQGVKLVLTGHKHQPWAWRVNDSVIATTGTFCSKKTNSGQNFNLIDLTDGIRVENIDVWTGDRTQLLHMEATNHA